MREVFRQGRKCCDFWSDSLMLKCKFLCLNLHVGLNQSSYAIRGYKPQTVKKNTLTHTHTKIMHSDFKTGNRKLMGVLPYQVLRHL